MTGDNVISFPGTGLQRPENPLRELTVPFSVELEVGIDVVTEGELYIVWRRAYERTDAVAAPTMEVAISLLRHWCDDIMLSVAADHLGERDGFGTDFAMYQVRMIAKQERTFEGIMREAGVPALDVVYDAYDAVMRARARRQAEDAEDGEALPAAEPGVN